MPNRRKTPSYRHHKPSGRAVVTLNGHDHYLGLYDSPESKALYDRLIGEWLISGRKLPQHETTQPSTVRRPERVKDVILAYMEHAETYYRGPNGEPTSEINNLEDALQPVLDLYGKAPAVDFGPLALRAVRQHMIETGLARTTINARIHRIRRCFRWAVSVEKIPGSVIHELETVEALGKGRSEAKEADPVQAVPVEDVDATLPYLNRIVAAMVKIQLLTGCRAGEVMIVRARDLRPSKPNWQYRPSTHKTSWRGKERIIPIGPKAQAILEPFLVKLDVEAFLFDPRDALLDLEEKRTGKRRKLRGTRRYTRISYRQAVARACDRAFPHPILSAIPPRKRSPEQREQLLAWRKQHRWSPLQLRHTHGTLVRAKYGLEGAQVALGHSRADVTQIYAERDQKLAEKIALEIG